MNQKIRLNRFLSLCGLGARRKCEDLIYAGRVSINQQVIQNFATWVDPTHDQVLVDGKIVAPVAQMVYVLLNKPAGYLSAVSDDRDRKTVLTLINSPVQIKPVGRLDYDTTGALLLTNDGQLAYRLTHPKFVVEKEYHVVLNRPLENADLRKLEQGVYLEDGKTAPCKARYRKERNQIALIIHEGRNRQVKRMFESLKYRVKELTRIKFAGLTISDLNPGEWRYLSRDELQRIQKLTGMMEPK
ncbi:rRNA pseudouridine synthase [candidate division KSB1 bacterium]|nr:rRNA pseudouridine synthase [candidate division KSB1 bacterium]